jgi:DNA-binding transcriptional LysR family regulator
VLHRLGVPEHRQRIFQSDAAALEETTRGNGVALAVGFSVSGDLAAGRLVPLEGPRLRAQGRWMALALPRDHQPPAAAELLRFITTPRATQAMVRGAGVHLGRFKPAVHVTLWS